MLVLTRKPQETIRIGNDIVVTVIRTKGKAVRLGIEAPNTVAVLRGEIALDLSPEVNDSEENADEAPAQVLHARVPRGQVTQVLPQLSMGAGPLAAMVHSR
jgi:carbon storage regulator CsrA